MWNAVGALKEPTPLLLNLTVDAVVHHDLGEEACVLRRVMAQDSLVQLKFGCGIQQPCEYLLVRGTGINSGPTSCTQLQVDVVR